jgi:hypothetical protein
MKVHEHAHMHTHTHTPEMCTCTKTVGKYVYNYISKKGYRHLLVYVHMSYVVGGKSEGGVYDAIYSLLVME